MTVGCCAGRADPTPFSTVHTDSARVYRFHFNIFQIQRRVICWERIARTTRESNRKANPFSVSSRSCTKKTKHQSHNVALLQNQSWQSHSVALLQNHSRVDSVVLYSHIFRRHLWNQYIQSLAKRIHSISCKESASFSFWKLCRVSNNGPSVRKKHINLRTVANRYLSGNLCLRIWRIQVEDLLVVIHLLQPIKNPVIKGRWKIAPHERIPSPNSRLPDK